VAHSFCILRMKSFLQGEEYRLRRGRERYHGDRARKMQDAPDSARDLRIPKGLIDL
jgi:hypothetical protein